MAYTEVNTKLKGAKPVDNIMKNWMILIMMSLRCLNINESINVFIANTNLPTEQTGVENQ